MYLKRKKKKEPKPPKKKKKKEVIIREESSDDTPEEKNQKEPKQKKNKYRLKLRSDESESEALDDDEGIDPPPLSPVVNSATKDYPDILETEPFMEVRIRDLSRSEPSLVDVSDVRVDESSREVSKSPPQSLIRNSNSFGHLSPVPAPPTSGSARTSVDIQRPSSPGLSSPSGWSGLNAGYHNNQHVHHNVMHNHPTHHLHNLIMHNHPSHHNNEKLRQSDSLLKRPSAKHLSPVVEQAKIQLENLHNTAKPNEDQISDISSGDDTSGQIISSVSSSDGTVVVSNGGN